MLVLTGTLITGGGNRFSEGGTSFSSLSLFVGCEGNNCQGIRLSQ